MYSREKSHGDHLDLSLGMSVHGTEDDSNKKKLQVAMMHRPDHVGSGLESERTWFGPLPPPQSEVMMREGSPVVGWPPVRAYRKNLSGVRQSAKEAKKSKVVVDASPMTMFVKVNMEGLAVGRKIDLMAHDGYGSLSATIQKLFCSFLSADKKTSIDGADDENGDHVKISGSLELLYEDNEGDKLLVGDVPWEMFVGSVKRLYITYRRKTYHR